LQQRPNTPSTDEVVVIVLASLRGRLLCDLLVSVRAAVKRKSVCDAAVFVAMQLKLHQSLERLRCDGRLMGRFVVAS